MNSNVEVFYNQEDEIKRTRKQKLAETKKIIEKKTEPKLIMTIWVFKWQTFVIINNSYEKHRIHYKEL